MIMETKFSQFKSILILGILAMGIGFSSCSNDDEEIVSLPKDAKLKLKAEKQQIVPFEDLKVSIDVDLDLLYEHYDSIQWKANGVAYHPWGNPWENIDEERDIRLSDYKIGKHKAYALGYKDGKVISKDSIEYEVVKTNGDFLSARWNTAKKNSYLCYTTGMTPNQFLPTHSGWTKIGGVMLQLNHTVQTANREYATLLFLPWAFDTNLKSTRLKSIPDINNFEWHTERDPGDIERAKIEYEFLHNYLVEFYGEPALTYSGDDVTQTTLKEEYAKRFDYVDQDGFLPVEIWETPSSVICLSTINNRIGGKNQKGPSLVIAQPRK